MKKSHYVRNIGSILLKWSKIFDKLLSKEMNELSRGKRKTLLTFWQDYPEIQNKLKDVQALMIERLKINNQEIEAALEICITWRENGSSCAFCCSLGLSLMALKMKRRSLKSPHH